MGNIQRCPQCGGEIDYFDSCRKCGREWSEHLEPEEQAKGLPEGQHESIIKQPKSKRSPRNKYTKPSSSKEPTDKYSLWRIDANNDNETEIINKRSLMRLDSRRMYAALGLVSRAYDAQRGALLWLQYLTEFLNEDERKTLAPTTEFLKRAFSDTARFRQTKVAEAAEMETELEKAHRSARAGRIRLLDEEANQKVSTKQSVPDLAIIDSKALETMTPDELLEIVKMKLANLDQEKVLRKRVNPDEDE